MLRVALKGILAHKLRLVTTSLAVLLGVAFMAGTLVLTDTVGRTFDDLFAEIGEDTDAVVRNTEVIDTGFGGEQRGRIDKNVADLVRTVDGVAASAPFVQGFAQFVDRDGDTVGNPGAGAPTFGFNWIDEPALNPFTIVEGEPPQGNDQIVIDRGTAQLADFGPGDTVTVLTQTGPQQVEVSGVARFGSVDSPGGATVAMFTLPKAQEVLIDDPTRIDSVSVVAEEGVSQDELVQRLQAALPSGVEAITGEQSTEESQDAIQEGLSFFNTFLLVFAIVALVVGSFIIYNTFSIIVAQRSREMALMRAIGASRRQVLGSVLVEALVVGLISAVLGMAVGVLFALGMRELLAAVGVDIPASGLVIAARTFVVSLVVGVGITVFSAVVPGRRASRIPPIAALRDVAIDTSAGSRPRILSGIAVVVAGVGLLLLGLYGDTANAGVNIGLGLLLVFVGVFVLGPVIAKPVSSFIGWPLPRVKGVTGQLARENALRNPKRTSATASALMIGVGIVSVITIFADSAKASIDQTIDDSFIGDFVVESNTFGFGGLPVDLSDRIDALPEVANAAGVRLGFATVDGQDEVLFGIDPVRGTEIVDVGIVAGDPADLDEDGIAVLESVADDRGWTIGTEVPVRFVETGPQTLTVEVIYTESELAGRFFLGLAAYEANFADQFDFQVYVDTAEGVEPEEARAAIQPLVDDVANAELQDLSEFKEAQASQIDQLLNLIYALLGLAIIIALMGIANTLALSIFERTRELGLLRAVGMTRSQLKSTVRWESVIIALLGTFLGLVIGLVVGWLLIQAFGDEGLTVFRVPIAQLVVIVVLAAVAGVAAAILPARRAARLDVLRAITTE